jgi:hypothetical protein
MELSFERVRFEPHDSGSLMGMRRNQSVLNVRHSPAMVQTKRGEGRAEMMFQCARIAAK